MNLTTLIAAATEGENHGHSETLFFVAGILLALFAVVVATIGIRKPDLPESANRAILGLGVVLALVAMASMVVIST
jgi:hypothetical protein